jgi:hypothetical protein
MGVLAGVGVGVEVGMGVLAVPVGAGDTTLDAFEARAGWAASATRFCVAGGVALGVGVGVALGSVAGVMMKGTTSGAVTVPGELKDPAGGPVPKRLDVMANATSPTASAAVTDPTAAAGSRTAPRGRSRRAQDVSHQPPPRARAEAMLEEVSGLRSPVDQSPPVSTATVWVSRTFSHCRSSSEERTARPEGAARSTRTC